MSGALTFGSRRKTQDTSAPYWILRHHTPSPIHALRVIRLHDAGRGDKHVLVCAGDAQGRVSITTLSDVRPRLFWKAHKTSVLGVDVTVLKDGSAVLLTSGRDNELHGWSIALQTASLESMPSRIQEELPVPESLFHFGINALNYCNFSAHGPLVAVPHALDSGYVDIVKLPGERIKRAIGKPDISSRGDRAPMIMSLHLIAPLEGEDDCLRILAGYEDGYVRLWRVTTQGADLLWSQRKHTESVMATAVSPDASFAVSVAADDNVVRYELPSGEVSVGACKSMGHASVAIRHEGNQIAVGGWDGNIRIFEKHLKRITKLHYHRDTVQAVAHVEERHCKKFAQDDEETPFGESDSSDEEKDTASLDLSCLLVTGGKEGRICLWQVP